MVQEKPLPSVIPGLNSAPKPTLGTLFRAWKSSLRPETYPLLGCMVGAFGLVAYYGGSYLLYSPDLNLTRARRREPMRTNYEEGERWVKHHKTMRNLLPGYIVTPGSSE